MAKNYQLYKLYAEQHGLEIMISEAGFVDLAIRDAEWRIKKLRDMGGDMPEVLLKVNTPEGGIHPITIYGRTFFSSEHKVQPVDGVISHMEDCMLRLNLADCPSIFLAERINGRVEAVSVWHFGYMPVHYGISQSFLDYCASIAKNSEEVIYITPGIQDIVIGGDRAKIFNPPDERLWEFAERRPDGTISVQLLAYARDLAKRSKAEYIIDASANTYNSPDHYSYRHASNVLRSGAVQADSAAFGFNAYCIAWE